MIIEPTTKHQRVLCVHEIPLTPERGRTVFIFTFQSQEWYFILRHLRISLAIT